MSDSLNASTQVQYPWRSALRTAVQTALAVIPVLQFIVPAVIQAVLDQFGETLPSSVSVWLLGASATIVGIATVASRIMAIPAVNQWLAKVGLATKPAEPIADAAG